MKKADNYLDYIFERNPVIGWDIEAPDEDDGDAAAAGEQTDAVAEETAVVSAAGEQTDAVAGEAAVVSAADVTDATAAEAADPRGRVALHIRHRGLSHAIAQKFFDKPEVTHVHLEPMGSFIWQQIDGQRSVYEIGQRLHDAFGEEAEPLYERLCVYVKNLERNGLIRRSK